jgi:hypothetical protein
VISLSTVMDLPASEVAVDAADDPRYRDFLTVALVVPDEYSFADNWIYVHSPDVQVGRIQNFGSWSSYMVKEGRTGLGHEYFVLEGEEMWNKPDEALIEQAKRELGILDLADPTTCPFYDEDHKANVGRIVDRLHQSAPNVHPVGRNGMHWYNNQDQPIYTAMLTADNRDRLTPRCVECQRRGGVPRGIGRRPRPGHPSDRRHWPRRAGDRARPLRRGSSTQQARQHALTSAAGTQVNGMLAAPEARSTAPTLEPQLQASRALAASC